MKKYLIALSCFVIFGGCFSQTVSGIMPPNFKEKIPKVQSFYILDRIDNTAEQNQARALQLQNDDKMLRFGKEVTTNILFKTVAEQFNQPNGRTIYQFGIKSKNALSINLILTQFELGDDAHLFLTDARTKSFIGAYTAANNNTANVLGTELLYSDEIIVVLDEPTNSSNPSDFVISTVVHGFEHLETLAKALNSSGQCHYDVNCPLGDGFELQRNSVAMIVNGGGICTGSLVNNTSGNIIPYFITARHCGTNPTNWVFRFRWEAPDGQTSCATTAPSGNGPENLNINGSILRAFNTIADFSLLELNSAPDPNWGVYYNGWDNTDIANVQFATAIHHPDGDIKKISRTNSNLLQDSVTFVSFPTEVWVVPQWDLGSTQVGSSGSPLFNQDKRLIGTLAGGDARCVAGTTMPNNSSDFYGRFGAGWDYDTTASQQLKFWLDPQNTGATIIDGVDPLIGYNSIDASLASLGGVPESICDSLFVPIFHLLNSGIDTLVQAQIIYGFNGNLNQTFNFTGSIPTYGSQTIVLPPMLIPIGNSDFEINITTANGIQDTVTTNNVISTSFIRLVPEFTADFALDLDCFGSETTWKLRDTAGHILYAGGPYSDGEEGLYEYEFCLSYGCYALELHDEYGDGMSGCAATVGGNGSYILTNQLTGQVLAQLSEANGNFGFLDTQTFCVQDNLSLADYELGNLIELFPNPGSTSLSIQTSSIELKSVVVYTITGQQIASETLSSKKTSLDTSNWSASVYIIRIETDKGILNQRWVKQ